MISSGLRRSANGAILKRYVSRDIPSRGAALLRRSSAAGHRQLKPRKKSTLALSSSTTSTPMSNSQLTQGLTWTQMKAVLISSAIPMVGFGAMDNFIMIQCGSLIDNTLGVQFGLATMTAAAMGQVVSDVSGVLFGGSVARLLSPYVKTPSLSKVQKQLPLVHRLRLAGAASGVMLGCMLGALSLYFVIDDDSARPIDHMAQLRDVVQDLIMTEGVSAATTSCTLYVDQSVNNNSHSVDPEQSSSPSAGCVQVAVTPLDTATPSADENVLACVSERELIFRNNSLYVPVLSSKGNDLLGVLKLSEGNADNTSKDFLDLDKKAAEQMARTIGIFMSHIRLVQG